MTEGEGGTDTEGKGRKSAKSRTKVESFSIDKLFWEQLRSKGGGAGGAGGSIDLIKIDTFVASEVKGMT